MASDADTIESLSAALAEERAIRAKIHHALGESEHSDPDSLPAVVKEIAEAAAQERKEREQAEKERGEAIEHARGYCDRMLALTTTNSELQAQRDATLEALRAAHKERDEVVEHAKDCGDNVLALVPKLAAAEAQRDAALEALRDRDELWCRALTCLDARQIQQVTEAFNRLRGQPAAAPPGRKESRSEPA